MRQEYYAEPDFTELQALIEVAPLQGTRFSHLTVINKHGRPIYNSKFELNPTVTAADRSYFRRFQDNPADALYLSLPTKGRNSKKVVVRAVRPLINGNGDFNGVIFIAIDASNLVRFVRQLELGANSSATLVGMDKRIRARSPWGELELGQDISGSQIWDRLQERSVGTYTQTSVVDGVERLYSYRKLADYPLIAAVGVPVTYLTQSGIDIRLMVFGFAGLASVIVLLLTYMVIRQSVNTRRLEQTSEAKDQFLGHMSHELRTPLNSIIGFSEIIALEAFGSSNNPKYVEYGKLINFAGKHLLTIINDILDLTKIRAGEREVLQEWLALEDLFRDADSLVGLKAGEKRQALSFSVEEDMPRIWADGNMVRQVLVNLIGNAIKFTPDGGTITVIAAFVPHRGFRLTVQDNGIGIPKDEIPRVLRPFEQVRSTVLTTSGGTGLGLPLARMLTEQNGGALSIASDTGAGTTVLLEFPADLAEQPHRWAA